MVTKLTYGSSSVVKKGSDWYRASKVACMPPSRRWSGVGIHVLIEESKITEHVSS